VYANNTVFPNSLPLDPYARIAPSSSGILYPIASQKDYSDFLINDQLNAGKYVLVAPMELLRRYLLLSNWRLTDSVRLTLSFESQKTYMEFNFPGW
jgi:hypothetical protein